MVNITKTPCPKIRHSLHTSCLTILIIGLGFSIGGAVYGMPISHQSAGIQVAQSVDIDAEDRDNDDDSNEQELRRATTGRVSATSGGCGATVRVGKISLASCLANKSAASAMRTFNRTNSRSNRSICNNTVSQSSSQSTTINGVTRRSNQSNVSCQ